MTEIPTEEERIREAWRQGFVAGAFMWGDPGERRDVYARAQARTPSAEEILNPENDEDDDDH